MADEGTRPDRYARQVRFPGIGATGQERIGAATVTVVGCGALGSAAVNLLVRGGVGTTRIIDRDVVELTNLQRQLLFDEDDAEAGLPKAIAAAKAATRINSEVRTEPVIADVTPDNVERLLAGSTVVVDATDNLETRYLVNDACVKNGIPWVYGGAIGATGMSMAIVPGRTPCFRCLFPAVPDGASLETCETAGILASSVVTVAAYQWTQVIRLVVGEPWETTGSLLTLDVWSGDYQVLPGIERRSSCPCCVERRFEFLDARGVSRAAALCGRNAMQVSPGRPTRIDLRALAVRLEGLGRPSVNDYLVKVTIGRHELTVFEDGRAIIRGTTDPAEARSLYARWVGA